MNKYIKYIPILVLLLSSITFGQVEGDKAAEFLKDATNKGKWEYDSFEISLNFEQPVNHDDPDGQKFTQRVFIKHVDFNKPVVIHDRGYFSRPGGPKTELTRMLNCNEVEIEHRYFAPSIPDSVDWNYLTIEQAAADQHAVVQWLKKYYPGKFIATGGSKGGQTALFHEYFYPDDNDVVVAFVAPINLEMEDSRIWPFIYDSISTAENREKIINYQRALLERREEVQPFVMKEIEESGDSLLAEYDLCYELAVMEFNFAWWQYGSGDIGEIPPPDAPAEILYKPFKGTIPFFMAAGRDMMDAFNYQAYTQIGFYCYDTAPFKDLLIAAKDDCASSKPLFYDHLWNKPFDPEPMAKVHDFLVNKAERVIFIYGGNDPWTAPGVWPSGKTSSFRMTKKGGNHGTGILSFEGEEQERILTALEEWLDVKISRRRVARIK